MTKQDDAPLRAKIAETLAPCPFCGSAAVLTSGVHDTHGPYVGCTNRECEIEQNAGQYASDAEAIAAWNTRSALDAPEPVVKVRELEWRDAGQGTWRADTDEGAGYYVVRIYPDNAIWAHYQREIGGTTPTYYEAKAAAKADYEHRSRSALDPSPAADARIAKPDRDSLRILRQFAAANRDGINGCEMDGPSAMAVALSIEDVLAALATQNGGAEA